MLYYIKPIVEPPVSGTGIAFVIVRLHTSSIK